MGKKAYVHQRNAEESGTSFVGELIRVTRLNNVFQITDFFPFFLPECDGQMADGE